MSTTTSLQATPRTLTGRKTDTLRAQGGVPAVVYGVGTQPKNVSVDRNAFVKVYKQAGESSIVELKIDDADPLHVLIQDYQQDPIHDTVTHVDFRIVDMTKPIETYVRLNFVGESLAIKGMGGTLMSARDGINIRCLPSKLLSEIDVDLSILKSFEDVIHIGDLKFAEGVEVLDEAELPVASVQAPRTEAQMAELDDAVEEDVTGVEVEGVKDENESSAESNESAE